jgi:hypothetical protein
VITNQKPDNLRVISIFFYSKIGVTQPERDREAFGGFASGRPAGFPGRFRRPGDGVHFFMRDERSFDAA